MIESTEAKIGRSMKKRENTTISLPFQNSATVRTSTSHARRLARLTAAGWLFAAGPAANRSCDRYQRHEPRTNPCRSAAPSGDANNVRLAQPSRSRRRRPASAGCRRSVTPSMPLKTAMPSDCRISAPAPWAIRSGTTPRMKAIEVMMIGRRRSRHASSVASRIGLPRPADQLGELDDQDRVLAGQPDQHHQADLGEDVDIHAVFAQRWRWSPR